MDFQSIVVKLECKFNLKLSNLINRDCQSELWLFYKNKSVEASFSILIIVAVDGLHYVE